MSQFRLLALTRYGRLGASSRMRFLQYVPFLERHDVDVSVGSLISDGMLQQRYRTNRYTIGAKTTAYMRRIRLLESRSQFDIVWIEKEALPWLPFWLEQRLLTRVPYIVDFDDAVFHNYDLHRSRFVRHFFGDRLDKLMAGSAAVIAGNEYLADRARAAGTVRVEILPTVVEMSRYNCDAHVENIDNRPRIVWIGSPATQQYLERVYAPLRALAQKHKFVLRVIGADVPSIPDVDTEQLPWQEESEVDDLRGSCIGIMPLFDSPWERGKCGYKLIQYMACGLPVVASPVGVNREIVQHGVCGLLADSDTDWVDSLDVLLDDASVRARLGTAGRKRVEEYYSLEVQGPRLLRILSEVALK